MLLVLVVCVLTRQTNEAASSVRQGARTPRGGLAMGDNPQAREAYGRLPLSFEANRGQTAPQVDFIARGSGYTLFVTPTEAVLTLRSPATPKPKTTDPKSLIRSSNRMAPGTDHTSDAQGRVLRMRLAGANATARPEGRDELRGKVNYFIGSDPKQWRSGVSTYAKVRYQGVYPGIDLVYYGNQRELEYDFIVAPTADPGAIALTFDGADTLEVDRGGNLVLHAGAEQIVQRAPRVYQEIDGVTRDVGGRYVLQDGRRRVRFEVGRYDRRQPLVIDPVLAYSTYLGGSGYEFGYGIAVDSAGNAYVTGSTDSPDFPSTLGAFETTRGGYTDAFVTKLAASGAGLVYSTYLGGEAGYENGEGIAVDSAGNAYVTGFTSSSHFPTTPGAFQTTLGGGLSADTFVTKVEATGAALAYSTYLGGSDADAGHGIAVDSAGNAYVSGTTRSPDFPTTLGAFDTTPDGENDAFVTKLEASGAALVYSTYLGGASNDFGNGIAVDSAGNAYVTGYTFSSDFPTTPGAFQTTFGGGLSADTFVTKVEATGAALAYSTYLGGSDADGGYGIAVDSAGDAYVSGTTSSPDFPTTPGAFDTTLALADAFVTKLEATGTALIYSTYLGGSNVDGGTAIGVDSAGNAYVTGNTYSIDFPTTAGAFQPTPSGAVEAFVTKLDVTGAALAYSTFLGGKNTDSGEAIAVDSAGNVFVTGYTRTSHFPITPGAFQPTHGGGVDAFVTKIALEPDIDLVETALSNPPAVVLLTDTFSVTDTVENHGSTPAAQSRTRYYLSLDTTKSAGDDRFTATRKVPALSPGGTSTGPAVLTVAASTKLGVYFLLACADDLNAVGETDETNNCRASTTTVEVRAPDLVETAVSNPPVTGSPGGSFSVTDTVANHGNAAADASMIRYYFSLNTTKGGSDLLLTGNRTVPALAVGAQSMGSVTVTIPAAVTPGTYYLLACGDDLNNVAERDEKNNCKASATRVSVGQ